MSPHALAVLVIVPLVAWRLYARTRRNFGRQPIQPRRMWVRVAIFSVITLLVASTGLLDPRLAAGLCAGLLGGVALGLLALRLTRFEIDGHRDCYYPNVWIGLALSALFVGRLAYRLLVTWPVVSTASPGAYPAFQRSPLTLAILGLLLGYYMAYYAGLLIHHRRVLAMQARA